MIASLLIIGAAATVVIAWSCTGFSTIHMKYSNFSGNQTWPPGTADSRERPTSEIRFEALGALYMVWWDRSFNIVDVSAGWPLKTLHARMTNARADSGTVIVHHDGIAELPEAIAPNTGGAHTARCLPWKPQPLPFILDTAFYAAIASLFPLSSSLLRSHRRGRGLCVKCRYDRKGLALDAPCPECGTLNAGPPAPRPGE